MKFLKNCWHWICKRKWHLLSFVTLCSVSIFFSISYLYTDIDNSLQEIENEIDYGIFSIKEYFGINEGYDFVSYSKADIPKLNDSSDIYKYGELKNYFIASRGWRISLGNDVRVDPEAVKNCVYFCILVWFLEDVVV